MFVNVHYYTAPWCAPCKRLLPLARRLAEEAGVARFEVVDIEERPGQVPVDVVGVPTVIVTRDDAVVARLSPDMVNPQALRKALGL